MTDTALHADVVLPATTQLEHLDVVFSWGHHYLTWNEPAIEPLGEAKPNTRRSGCSPRASASTIPAFRETDEELIDAMLADSPAVADRVDELRERGWLKIDLGQGRTPHAEGGFGTDERRGPSLARALRAAGRGGRRRAGRALPAGAHHAEDAPLPELDVREPGPPALGAAGAARVRAPRRRGGARHRGRRAGARVQRPRRASPARRGSPTTPARASLVAPMGWWNRDYEGGRSSQATTSQRAHRGGARADRSTTTAWSSAARSSRAARSPPWRPGSGPPPRRGASARSARLHRGEHRLVGRLLRPRAGPEIQSMSAPARSASTAASGTGAAIATAGCGQVVGDRHALVAELAAEQVGGHLLRERARGGEVVHRVERVAQDHAGAPVLDRRAERQQVALAQLGQVEPHAGRAVSVDWSAEPRPGKWATAVNKPGVAVGGAAPSPRTRPPRRDRPSRRASPSAEPPSGLTSRSGPSTPVTPSSASARGGLAGLRCRPASADGEIGGRGGRAAGRGRS